MQGLDSTMLKVFVYGTLKPGEYNYRRFCEGRVVEAMPAVVTGDLYDLPVGYPALTPGDRSIYGVVLTFADPKILGELDRLEDYDPNRSPDENEYEREQTEVVDLEGRSLGIVWIYRMSVSRAKQLGGTFRDSDRWTAG